MVSKRDFARVVKEMVFSITTPKSGFNKCGIFPFDVNDAKMAPSSMYKPVENPLNARFGCDDDQPNDGQTSDTVSHVSSSPMQHTSNSGFSPTLFSTPNVSNTSICSSCSSTAVNPLVKAGLVPSNLANAPEIQPKRRIIKARVLTEDEHYDFLKEKEKEDKELKELRRIERERREERETKKKRKRKKSPTPIPSGTDSNEQQVLASLCTDTVQIGYCANLR